MGCGPMGLAWNPAGFHGHQLQHNLRVLQLMAGSPRARRSSQGQNGARMLASSVAEALSGYLRARAAKETGSGGWGGLGFFGNTQKRCFRRTKAPWETCRLRLGMAFKHDYPPPSPCTSAC